MNKDNMLGYIGEKKEPKVIDMFKEIGNKAIATARAVDTLALEAAAKPEGYRPTDAEDAELGVMYYNILRAIADLKFSVDLLCSGDEDSSDMIEMFEQEIMCKEFLAARAMPKKQQPEHDCGDCPANNFCPAAHGKDDNCDFN